MEKNELKERVALYLKTRFVNHGRKTTLLRNAGLVYKKGRFNQREKKIIAEEVNKFLIQNDLTVESLSTYIKTFKTTFPIKTMCEKVVFHLPFRTLYDVFAEIMYSYHPNRLDGWNPQTDAMLLKLVEDGGRWKDIAIKLSRPQQLCRSQYIYLVRRVGDRWSEEEKMTLKMEFRRIMEQDGIFNKYEKLVEVMKRGSKSVHMMLCRHMSESIIKEKWDSIYEMKMMGYVLFFNYYCGLSLPLKEIFSSEWGEETEKILDGFMGSNLDRKIEVDEIFWMNISGEMGVSIKFVLAKFEISKKIYLIERYGDLLRVFKEKVKACLYEKKRDELIEKLRQSKKKRKRTKSSEHEPELLDESQQ
jgi:hypothetical protein